MNTDIFLNFNEFTQNVLLYRYALSHTNCMTQWDAREWKAVPQNMGYSMLAAYLSICERLKSTALRVLHFKKEKELFLLLFLYKWYMMHKFKNRHLFSLNRMLLLRNVWQKSNKWNVIVIIYSYYPTLIKSNELNQPVWFMNSSRRYMHLHV